MFGFQKMLRKRKNYKKIKIKNHFVKVWMAMFRFMLGKEKKNIKKIIFLSLDDIETIKKKTQRREKRKGKISCLDPAIF